MMLHHLRWKMVFQCTKTPQNKQQEPLAKHIKYSNPDNLWKATHITCFQMRKPVRASSASIYKSICWPTFLSSVSNFKSGLQLFGLKLYLYQHPPMGGVSVAKNGTLSNHPFGTPKGGSRYINKYMHIFRERNIKEWCNHISIFANIF